MYITATELRNNIKKHLDHVAEGHMLVVTRGNESFTLARKDLYVAPPGTGGTDKLLHSKVDAIIDAIERINKESPRISPAEPPKQQWQKVAPAPQQAGTPSNSRLDEIKKEISQIEDDLEQNQDPDEARRLFDRINNLYAEKDEILLQEAEK